MTGTDDRDRCAAVGVPRRRGFATKPLPALDMIRRFWLANRELGWVAGDEVYGADAELRDWLEEHRIGYALAVACDTRVTTAVGRRRVDTLGGLVPAGAWETYSSADGAKGPRLYDWALVDTTDLAGPDNRAQQVLIRRSRGKKKELAFYLTHSPRPVPLAALVTVAGRRWGIEECFQAAKNEVGLDHFQVRTYHAWYRHVTLAMLAHAWLAVTTAKTREQDPPDHPPATRAVGYQREGRGLAVPEQAEPAGTGMIPFSLNEIRHVLALFAGPDPTENDHLVVGLAPQPPGARPPLPLPNPDPNQSSGCRASRDHVRITATGVLGGSVSGLPGQSGRLHGRAVALEGSVSGHRHHDRKNTTWGPSGELRAARRATTSLHQFCNHLPIKLTHSELSPHQQQRRGPVSVGVRRMAGRIIGPPGRAVPYPQAGSSSATDVRRISHKVVRPRAVCASIAFEEGSPTAGVSPRRVAVMARWGRGDDVLELTYSN